MEIEIYTMDEFHTNMEIHIVTNKNKWKSRDNFIFEPIYSP